MADKVYPSRTAANGARTGGGPPPFPATKSQSYPNNRSAYRPGPRRSRSRGCCRVFCCCLFFTLLVLILAVGVASAVVYFLYHPHRPSFSVTSLKLSTFNISSSASTLTSQFDINITARNPNKKITYYYNPTSISIYTRGGIDVGDGSLPGFVHGTKNTTLLSASIASNGQQLDSQSVSTLKSEAKGGLPLVVRLDTKARVKMGSLKSPKVGIRITCDGITVNVPSGNATATASTAGARCKVHSRVKVWKWTF
ncbi:hypothetical protein MLD38_030750 [Melastoma candidum]|uniref:Uncharacterized protein n=1 Tax=Melastoma candidum TaxID=119954 RepID=A0ACB9MSQ1_9MYRT|nr:hypothetical protein MLD38_030750 [Melastoma candidum]